MEVCRMKPFLGIDITSDKSNHVRNGKEFLYKKTPAALLANFEHAKENLNNIASTALLSVPLRFILLVSGLISLVSFLWTISIFMDVFIYGLSALLSSKVYVLITAAVSICVSASLMYLAKKKEVRRMSADDAQIAIRKYDNQVNTVLRFHDVGADSFAVDILSFAYKNKHGCPVPRSSALSLYPEVTLDNLPCRVDIYNDKLILTNISESYAFDIKNIRKISTVSKRFALSSWNKKQKYDEAPYNNFYLVTSSKYPYVIFAKPYHILELEHNGEIWGIYFPCYELPTFEKLTGLKAEE